MDFEKCSSFQIRVAITLLGAVLFIPFLHQVHLFDWDEINFAEAAREMLVTGNYSQVQINYEPFWEKPPIFFWMQALCMNVFGINEFAARLPNALCGIATLLFLFQIGNRIQSKTFGIFWVFLYASSLLPLLYFRSGIIDPWFNLFIFGGIYFAFEYINEYAKNTSNPSYKWLVLAGVSIGLGIMTKGPVALLIFSAVYGAYWGLNRFRVFISFKGLLVFTLTLVLTGSFWFITEYISGRGYIIEEFITYQIRLLETQDAGHGGPFIYHWIVLLIGCFPLSVFALNSLFKNHFSGKSGLYQRLMFLLFWIVLILFSLVKTKIIHYSSLCYLPLSFFAAVGLQEVIKRGTLSLFQKTMFWILGIFWALAMFALPILGSKSKWLSTAEFINDEFAKANFQANVSWGAVHYLAGIVFLAGLVAFLIGKIDIKRVIIFLTATCTSFTLLMVTIVPNIEGYTQRAAIEFYKSKIGQDCYVDTYGFKSYADLFYSQKPKFSNPNHSDLGWLLNGECDKPVFLVMKITSMEDFESQYPHFSHLESKNGFAFYERKIPTPPSY
ncbi:MAG: glycosyltransferase family 39 protein [Flavobacteriales bacterium]|nr:glycosyltransferase family 39 protein [Flavobacteriales bacterium]